MTGTFIEGAREPLEKLADSMARYPMGDTDPAEIVRHAAEFRAAASQSEREFLAESLDEGEGVLSELHEQGRLERSAWGEADVHDAVCAVGAEPQQLFETALVAADALEQRVNVALDYEFMAFAYAAILKLQNMMPDLNPRLRLLDLVDPQGNPLTAIKLQRLEERVANQADAIARGRSPDGTPLAHQLVLETAIALATEMADARRRLAGDKRQVDDAIEASPELAQLRVARSLTPYFGATATKAASVIADAIANRSHTPQQVAEALVRQPGRFGQLKSWAGLDEAPQALERFAQLVVQMHLGGRDPESGALAGRFVGLQQQRRQVGQGLETLVAASAGGLELAKDSRGPRLERTAAGRVDLALSLIESLDRTGDRDEARFQKDKLAQVLGAPAAPEAPLTRVALGLLALAEIADLARAAPDVAGRLQARPGIALANAIVDAAPGLSNAAGRAYPEVATAMMRRLGMAPPRGPSGGPAPL